MAKRFRAGKDGGFCGLWEIFVPVAAKTVDHGMVEVEIFEMGSAVVTGVPWREAERGTRCLTHLPGAIWRTL